MIRIALSGIALSAVLSLPVRAENPMLAADLVGKYRAYKSYCSGETDRVTEPEVKALSLIAMVLGYDGKDSSLNDLADKRENDYTMLWINMGKKYSTCVETLAFLRSLAKQAER